MNIDTFQIDGFDKSDVTRNRYRFILAKLTSIHLAKSISNIDIDIFGFKKLRTAEARLYRSNSHQSRFRHFEMARSGTSSASSMRHWTKKGDALEELHRAHSISTVSYNRVNLDPLERGRQETIQRREREIVRQEDSSTGSCEEEIREINAAEFQANVEQRRRVRRRLPETPPSDHSPEASETGLLRGIPAFTTRKGG